MPCGQAACMERDIFIGGVESTVPSGTGTDAPAKVRKEGKYRMVTDLPDVLPITDAELDLLEAALGDFLTEILGEAR